jgi:putative transposase
MPNYRRHLVPGGCYFFTQVTYRRRHWLCEDLARLILREAITAVRKNHPFDIERWVLLPDHLHCLWRLPEGDSNYSTRWSLIKSRVTGCVAGKVGGRTVTPSRSNRRERSVWQRRFYEHTIRDQEDFRHHSNHIHYNPVKHGLCQAPKDWPYSSFHRWVKEGRYEENWGSQMPPEGIDRIQAE